MHVRAVRRIDVVDERVLAVDRGRLQVEVSDLPGRRGRDYDIAILGDKGSSVVEGAWKVDAARRPVVDRDLLLYEQVRGQDAAEHDAAAAETAAGRTAARLVSHREVEPQAEVLPRHVQDHVRVVVAPGLCGRVGMSYGSPVALQVRVQVAEGVVDGRAGLQRRRQDGEQRQR